MKRRSWLVLLAVALRRIVASYRRDRRLRRSEAAAKKAGTIEVLSLWGGSEKDAFMKVTAAFTKKTGIKVEYTTARDFAPAIRTRLAAGNPPDIAIIPRPGVLADLGEAGCVERHWRAGSDERVHEARVTTPAWSSSARFGGKLYGVPAKANSKSVVWYRPDQFTKYKLKVREHVGAAARGHQDTESEGPDTVGAGSEGLLDAHRLVRERVHAARPDRRSTRRSSPARSSSPIRPWERHPSRCCRSSTTSTCSAACRARSARVRRRDRPRLRRQRPSAQLYFEGGFVGGIATQQVNKKLKPGKTINSFPLPDDQRQVRKPVCVGAGDLAPPSRTTPTCARS